MYLYIEIVDVVANAFMDLLSRGGKRSLLFSEMDAYGARVIEALNKEKNIHAIFVVSQDSQHDICVNYSEYFEEYKNELGERGIKLRENVDAMQLWERFCAALSLKIIKAFQKVRV